MTDMNDAKAVLQSYLQESRDSLVWKVEGLSEREVRLPRTPTGSNLLGLLKHAAAVEIGYFGPTFGRPWPGATFWDDADPQSDLYATADESRDGMVDVYRQVWTFADETIGALPLDARGRVAWWGPGGTEVTLQRVMVHVATELARHAGHADILREHIDGATGLSPRDSNLPDLDWPAYAAKLTVIADQFA